MHITMRKAFVMLTGHENERLKEYLGPMLSVVAVNTLGGDWPDEIKAKFRADSFEDLNSSEEAYALCSQFDEPAPAGGRGKQILSRLINAVGLRVATQIGQAIDPITQARVASLALTAFEEFNISEPLQRFKRDSKELPPYLKFKMDSK
jgi:hypothetical protein